MAGGRRDDASGAGAETHRRRPAVATALGFGTVVTTDGEGGAGGSGEDATVVAGLHTTQEAFEEGIIEEVVVGAAVAGVIVDLGDFVPSRFEEGSESILSGIRP